MSDQKRGILTIISGFSGAGKGTVVHRLLEKYPEKYKLSISATTRSPSSTVYIIFSRVMKSSDR